MDQNHVEEIDLELDELVVEELETRLEMAAGAGACVSCENPA